MARAAARSIVEDSVSKVRKSPTVEDCLSAWIASSERRGCAEGTKSFYFKKSLATIRILGFEEINALTLARIERFADQRKLEGANAPTIAKEVGTLRSALRHAAKHNKFDGDANKICPDWLRGSYVPRDRRLTRAEFDKLLLALNAERRDYLIAYVLLGVRAAELQRITWEDVDFAKSRIHIRGRKGKKDRADRWVPLQPDAAAVLLRRSTEEIETPFPVWLNERRDLHAACKRVGIPPVSPNDLRRTFVTWLGEAGVPELVTASLVGHSGSAMIRRVYSRIGSDAQERAIEQLGRVTVGTEQSGTVAGTERAGIGTRMGHLKRSSARENP